MRSALEALGHTFFITKLVALVEERIETKFKEGLDFIGDFY